MLGLSEMKPPREEDSLALGTHCTGQTEALCVFASRPTTVIGPAGAALVTPECPSRIRASQTVPGQG